MEDLKSRAPFWKKEVLDDGDRWVATNTPGTTDASGESLHERDSRDDDIMHIRVLGSAAGGGYPQWNCNHPNSRRARIGDPDAPARTQSSIAVSADGEQWILFNASPDLRQQIFDNDILHPSGALRASPIKAVVLTNADVDHVAGLLNLRESQAFNLYGTPRVLSVLVREHDLQCIESGLRRAPADDAR